MNRVSNSYVGIGLSLVLLSLGTSIYAETLDRKIDSRTAIVLIGLLAIAFRLEKTAYRYASITLAIIVLIPRSTPPWNIALHRFIEVSVGIIVALAVVALWPEHQPSAAKSADE